MGIFFDENLLDEKKKRITVYTVSAMHEKSTNHVSLKNRPGYVM